MWQWSVGPKVGKMAFVSPQQHQIIMEQCLNNLCTTALGHWRVVGPTNTFFRGDGSWEGVGRWDGVHFDGERLWAELCSRGGIKG